MKKKKVEKEEEEEENEEENNTQPRKIIPSNIVHLKSIEEEYEIRKKQHEKEISAAITIQRVFRGYIFRKKFIPASKTIKFLYEKYENRDESKGRKEFNDCATKIQSLFRGHQCRKRFVDFNKRRLELLSIEDKSNMTSKYVNNIIDEQRRIEEERKRKNIKFAKYNYLKGTQSIRGVDWKKSNQIILTDTMESNMDETGKIIGDESIRIEKTENLEKNGNEKIIGIKGKKKTGVNKLKKLPIVARKRKSFSLPPENLDHPLLKKKKLKKIKRTGKIKKKTGKIAKSSSKKNLNLGAAVETKKKKKKNGVI